MRGGERMKTDREYKKGMRQVFVDPNSAEYLDVQRKRSGHGLQLGYGTRFCESCQMRKPKGKRKAAKGWKCDDCMRASK